MLIPLSLVFAAVCLSVTGELFLKSGMNEIGLFSFSNLWPTLKKILSSWRILTGFAFFGAGALFWLSVLSRVDLSWAYPMLSVGYVLVLLFSALVLKEPVSGIRWFGALVVCLGVFLVSRS